MLRSTASGIVFACILAGAAGAASVTPVSYAMQNGETGSYQYWDQSYNAPGAPVTTSLAALSGGLGDLTDGVIASDNWGVAEAPAGNGPYVGWYTVDPVITFYFDKAYAFTSITAYFDDSNGAGGVYPPVSMSINGGAPVAIVDQPSGAPYSHTVNLAITTDTLSMTLSRRQPNYWIMLSEVTFEASAQPGVVPVPAALPLLASGLGALALFRRRRTA